MELKLNPLYAPAVGTVSQDELYIIAYCREHNIISVDDIKRMAEVPLFAIIPMSVLEDKTVSAMAKLLYAEILALSKKSGYCYATNEHLADSVGIEKSSINRPLKELRDRKLIDIITEYEKNGRKGTYRYISVPFVKEQIGGLFDNEQGGLLNNEHKRDIHKIEIHKECKDTLLKSNVKIFIDWYFTEYQNRFGVKYIVNGGKDGSTVKKLLAHYDLEKLKSLATEFLTSNDKFMLTAGYTIGVFFSQINKLELKKNGKNKNNSLVERERGQGYVPRKQPVTL